MLYCSVKNCNNGINSNMSQRLSSFGLPKNSTVRRKWLQFAEIEENTNVRICMEHFEKKFFKTFYPRPLLRLDAVPTIHKPKKCDLKKSRKVKSEKDMQILSTDTTTSPVTFTTTPTTTSSQTEEKEQNSTTEILEISKMPTTALKVEEKMVNQVELACHKVLNITVTGKDFKTFTLYDLGDCTLKIQFAP